jgi:dihydrolipoamide dehydrogenase
LSAGRSKRSGHQGDHRRHRVAPRSVPGVEIDRKRIITSDEAIGLGGAEVDRAILGSGAVGVEFASIFRRFGSEVTIIELLPRLVPIEDEAVSAELEKAFKKQGIKVLTGTKVTKATRRSEGASSSTAEVGDGKTEQIRPSTCSWPPAAAR